LAQNLIGFIVAVILISTKTLGAPTGYLILDLSVTLLWIVGLTNSINFFDNIDGGASGTVAISAVTLTLLGFLNGQYLVAAMAAVLAGSTLGFLEQATGPNLHGRRRLPVSRNINCCSLHSLGLSIRSPI
jgi:UDP-GlcNAc:undecaprenyl-phosphate GlcNAc-1-phosphate transferase